METKFTPKRITVHCSVSRDGEFLSLDTLREWHLARGFSDIGYHFIVGVSGKATPGRPITQMGAHVESGNVDNVGICLVGTSKFYLEQFEGLKAKITELQEQYQIPDWEIYCHYEFNSAKKQGKTCPNIRIANLLSYLKTGKLDAIQDNILERKDS